MASNPASAATVAAALAHGSRLLRTDPDSAAAQAREILRVMPTSADAYRLLARALRTTGADETAEEAELDAIIVSTHDPLLIRAGQALVENDIPTAESLLRPRLKEN